MITFGLAWVHWTTSSEEIILAAGDAPWSGIWGEQTYGTQQGRRMSLHDGGIGSTDSDGFYFVHPREGERDFYTIGLSTQTDKVLAPIRLPGCLQNDKSCTRPSCTRPECRPWGHHYDTIYQQRLGPYSRDDVEPFQFLGIGFFNGAGYDSVSDNLLTTRRGVKVSAMMYWLILLLTTTSFQTSIESFFQMENVIPSKLHVLNLDQKLRENGHGVTLQQKILDIKTI